MATITSPYDQALLQAILRQDLGSFVIRTVQTVSPGHRYQHNWHIDAIIHSLLGVYKGLTRRLIITQPPRSLKSICSSVAFVAWWLGHDPAIRVACVSYSNELAATFARQFRTVLSSPWYRSLFPAVRLAKDSETETVTSQGGGRFAVSLGGSFTGRGADVIIIDDPLKADDAQSEAARRGANDWIGTTLLSRLDDKQKGAIILVMQRLHEDDPAGKLLHDGGWQHLDLPAIAQEDQVIAIGPGKVYRRRQGEVLHPAREPLATLDELKRGMGSLAFSAQYLQRPIPVQGNLVKASWLRSYLVPPARDSGDMVIASWDTAMKPTDLADYSVGTVWLVGGDTCYLLDVVRARFDYPALKRAVLDVRQRWTVDHTLIEDKASGTNLIQDLRCAHVAVVAIRPEADKLTRLYSVQGTFEAGAVVFPAEAPWLADLRAELLGFPATRHDDQVDSISQALSWIMRRRQRQSIDIGLPITIPRTDYAAW